MDGPVTPLGPRNLGPIATSDAVLDYMAWLALSAEDVAKKHEVTCDRVFLALVHGWILITPKGDDILLVVRDEEWMTKETS